MEALEPICSCAVCYEIYDEGDLSPRILPCGHTYCYKCLGEMGGRQIVNCPTCQRLGNYTDDFPVNYCCLALANEYKQHEGMEQGRVQPETYTKCREVELLRVCTDCEGRPKMCRECIAKDHSGHRVVSVQHLDKVEQARQKLNRLTDTVDIAKRKVEQAALRLDEFLAQINVKMSDRDEVALAYVENRQRIDDRMSSITDFARRALLKLCNFAEGCGMRDTEENEPNTDEDARIACFLLFEKLSVFNIPGELRAKVDVAPDLAMCEMERLSSSIRRIKTEMEMRLESFEQFIKDEVLVPPPRPKPPQPVQQIANRSSREYLVSIFEKNPSLAVPIIFLTIFLFLILLPHSLLLIPVILVVLDIIR